MNCLTRFTPRLVSTSAVSSTARRLYATETEVTKKKAGAVSGGLAGFLLGVTLAGSVGYYYLLEEYNSASVSLLSSVQELQASTDKVKDYARKIETIDKDVAKLKELTATAQQLTELKTEFRKLYDTLNLEHLELKSHVWGIEQDLHRAKKQ